MSAERGFLAGRPGACMWPRAWGCALKVYPKSTVLPTWKRSLSLQNTAESFMTCDIYAPQRAIPPSALFFAKSVNSMPRVVVHPSCPQFGSGRAHLGSAVASELALGGDRPTSPRSTLSPLGNKHGAHARPSWRFHRGKIASYIHPGVSVRLRADHSISL